MVNLWRFKFDEKGLPEWRDFEFKDFAGWYGQLSLGQVTPDFSEMTHLLWGTLVTDWWSKDYTKKAMKEDSLTLHRETIEALYVTSLFENKGIGLCGGNLHVYGREFVRICYVDFPLIYKDETTQILSVYSRTANLKSIPDIKPEYEYVER